MLKNISPKPTKRNGKECRLWCQCSIGELCVGVEKIKMSNELIDFNWYRFSYVTFLTFSMAFFCSFIRHRVSCSISKSQIGFIEFIIQDMMNAWDGFIDMPELIQYMSYNYTQWKVFEEQGINTLNDIKRKQNSISNATIPANIKLDDMMWKLIEKLRYLVDWKWRNLNSFHNMTAFVPIFEEFLLRFAIFLPTKQISCSLWEFLCITIIHRFSPHVRRFEAKFDCWASNKALSFLPIFRYILSNWKLCIFKGKIQWRSNRIRLNAE